MNAPFPPDSFPRRHYRELLVHPRLSRGINWYWGSRRTDSTRRALHIASSPRILFTCCIRSIRKGSFQTYWVVYRDTDNIDPLTPGNSEVIPLFDRPILDRQRIP
jgi:hypothetical protein